MSVSFSRRRYKEEKNTGKTRGFELGKVVKTQDFDYLLPSELIAKYPLAKRSASRLLCLDRETGEIVHRQFMDLLALVEPNDLLVFNDTRVISARLYGAKASGGKIEILIERVLSQHQALAHIRASKSPKPGTRLIIGNNLEIAMLAREGDLFKLEFPQEKNIYEYLEQYGEVPLPPYLERQVEPEDKLRYQTVFAQKKGAVAAPTAGLHFDEDLLQALQKKGVQSCFVTLHVGAGTFQPLRVEDLSQHTMHSEWLQVSETVCSAVQKCRENKGRVIAVGTTVVRCLETAAQTGELKPYCGDTQLFLRPGSEFHCVDALITNFHLPKSSLLMLVSAFAGFNAVMHAYQVAVAEKYRFYSYGDAMWIAALRIKKG